MLLLATNSRMKCTKAIQDISIRKNNIKTKHFVVEVDNQTTTLSAKSIKVFLQK